MPVQWVADGEEVHRAERVLVTQDGVILVRMQVESHGKSGWGWHVWDHPSREQQRYGLADTLAEAKAEAEAALAGLA